MVEQATRQPPQPDVPKIIKDDFIEIPSSIPPEQVLEYMAAHGIERAFQDKMHVPIDLIDIEEDVIDHSHMDSIRMLNLDHQIEEISIVAKYNIDGELRFEVTNGHHRFVSRREQQETRKAKLTIKAKIRYGVTEAEIDEMRLVDLNSHLNGVMFLRVSRWLTRAFTKRKWQSEIVQYAIDKGILPITKAIEFAANPASKTSFKVLFNDDLITLSGQEKQELVNWVQTMTHNIPIGMSHLRGYLEVAELAPESLIKMVDIKSGGGHSGRGKITFNFLKQMVAQFGMEHEALQLAIAEACIKQNVTAQRVGHSNVLQRIHQAFQQNGQNISGEVTHILSRIGAYAPKQESDGNTGGYAVSNGNHRRNGASAEPTELPDDLEYRPEPTEAGDEAESDQNPVYAPIVSRVEKIRKRRERNIEQGLTDSSIMIQLEDGTYAIFDAVSRILATLPEDNTPSVSVEFQLFEASLFAALYAWDQDQHTPTAEEKRVAIFGPMAKTNEKTDQILKVTERSLEAKKKAFFLKHKNRLVV